MGLLEDLKTIVHKAAEGIGSTQKEIAIGYSTQQDPMAISDASIKDTLKKHLTDLEAKIADFKKQVGIEGAPAEKN